jgi:phospholipid/cholesterol/gamma-HCH transport system substrate-binding protein
MHLTRQIRIQLLVFLVIALASIGIVFFGYNQIQSVYFGVNRYTVRLELPDTGNLFKGGNVTYRGYEVGRVEDVRLTQTGAEAVLKLDSNIKIPADLKAEVHSVSAIGEQFVQLLPQSGTGPSLKDGDVIPVDRTSVPPNINSLLEAANRGLNAIPRDNLKTVIDESYVAVGGLGPELSRLVNGATTLAGDARKNLDALVTVLDESKPLLDSQIDSSDSIQSWAASLARITTQLQTNDAAIRGILRKGPSAADEARQLLDRLQPTLPIVLANLVSVGQVAVTYRDDLEALLVLLPQGTAAIQGILLPNYGTKQDYQGGYLSFNLNLNLPPPCATGFYPIQQMRSPSLVDAPDRPPGLVYCRIPQDSWNDVRGLRNLPCETRPGKRAPTVEMCESDQEYVPLNDGFNWKGDPNATLTGQGVPQFNPGEAPPVPTPPASGPPPSGPPASKPPGPSKPPPSPAALQPIATAEYDPDTGTYVGPDGRVYRQSNLARDASKKRTWQQMLLPMSGN